MKDNTRLQNALRATKARVDTQWKKSATTTTTTTNAVAATKTNATGEVQKTTTTATAAGQRKILTRSNSVRLGTSTTTGLGLQRHASSHLLVGQNRVKTLTTKVVESKVQQQVKGNK